MTNVDKILWAFEQNGYKMTLGYVLKFPWGYKFASRCADLRKRGYQINCIKGQTPSENVYELRYFDAKGQGELI